MSPEAIILLIMAAKIQRNRDNSKKWREKNKENVSIYNKQYHKQYYECNKEYVNNKNKEYYYNNKEKSNMCSKLYRDTHKIELKNYYKEYRKKNKDKRKKYYKQYYKDNKMKYTDAHRRRKILEKNLPTEKFTSLEIYMRDGWVCQLCKKRVDKKLKYPHPMSASLDHIVPVSQGGPHLKTNVHLAHLSCNLNAGVGGIKQLRMFG